jgi:hypothetical protein
VLIVVWVNVAATFVIDLVFRPWGGQSVILVTVWRQRPRPSIAAKGMGWSLAILECAFRIAQIFSLSHWIRESISLHYRWDTTKRYWRPVIIDLYLLVEVTTIVLFFVFASDWPTWFITGVITYFLAETAVSSANVVVFGHLRGQPAVASIQRNFVLAFITFGLSVLAFAAIRLANGDDFKIVADHTHAWADSLKTATFISADAVTTLGWTVISAQLMFSVWMLVVMLSWTIAGFPSRSRR